jgi:hypothetical protein
MSCHCAASIWGEHDAYRLLDGVPLSLAALAALSDRARTRALDELAGTIDALRGFPCDRARAAGFRLRSHEGFGHPSQRELHRRHAARLGSEAVAHADLKPEHLLHDPTSRRITAVLADEAFQAMCIAGLHAHLDGLT